MTSQTCRICGNIDGLRHYSVSEMMMGTHDVFDYFQCPSCGCLQISEIPANLGKYYPENYYSYRNKARNLNYKLRSWIDRQRVLASLRGTSTVGSIVNRYSKPLEYISWIRDIQIDFDSAILDIGCGQGRLLLRMSMGGFTNLTGVDPFIDNDISYYDNIRIHKQDLDEFSDSKRKYDLIMLHHSLEHMPDQSRAFDSISKLLSPGGTALIRIPLADSYAWEHYRENWVQLDPPRHLYLHSRESLGLLAEKHGFIVSNVVYDSAKFQFTGSELYLRDIPLSSDKKTRKIFSKKQLEEFETRAEELNNLSKGDQAIFYLKKTSPQIA
jgi:SAM-dependent methyltransferase